MIIPIYLTPILFLWILLKPKTLHLFITLILSGFALWASVLIPNLLALENGTPGFIFTRFLTFSIIILAAGAFLFPSPTWTLVSTWVLLEITFFYQFNTFPTLLDYKIDGVFLHLLLAASLPWVAKKMRNFSGR